MKYFKRLAAAVLSLGMLAGCRKTVPEQASSAGLSVIETELPVATEVPEETETPEIKETPEETVRPAETKEPNYIETRFHPAIRHHAGLKRTVSRISPSLCQHRHQ